MTKSLIQMLETEGNYLLKVAGYALSAEEFKEVRRELESLDFVFTNLEADTIEAQKQGNYEDIFKTLEVLEADGWSW
jgi:hypothetical protein